MFNDFIQNGSNIDQCNLHSRLPECGLGPEAHARLRALDELLIDHGIGSASLCPGKERATTFLKLGELLVSAYEAPEVVDAFIGALESLVDATLTHFPGNLFWDHDFIAGQLLNCAHAHDGDTARYLEAWGAVASEIYALFGQHSPICFQYTHDFLYGYDSTRWEVPESLPASEQQDFSLSFLLAIRSQGTMMVELIDQGHPALPVVPDGTFRNSYPFERTPEQEAMLMPLLAVAGLLPLEGWSLQAQRTPGYPYREFRNRLALSMGLTRESD